MKKMLLLLACGLAFTCKAQTIDTGARKAALYFHEADSAANNQQVWKDRLYGPMLFVDLQTRVTYANQPDSAGMLKPVDGIYKGLLPLSVMVGNTAINWEGGKWSVILWPLPADKDDRVNLMLHESFHRIQAQIGLPLRSPTIDYLSTMNGRIYFILELQALKAALGKPVDQRKPDLIAALHFRYKRRELFPEKFKNEQLLETTEGLAEYTGMILGRPENHILKHLYSQLDTVANRRSFVRSAAYLTGPVYGYLLYQKSPDWTTKVDSNSDFPLLLAHYYHIPLPLPPISTAALVQLAQKYNGDSIIGSEKIKEQKRLETFAAYVNVFTKKPVLILDLVKLGVMFNPNNLFDLGDYGTVYPTAQIKDIWGELNVSANGMLMKDWKTVTVSMNKFTMPDNHTLNGDGWIINMTDGWKLEKIDALHYVLRQ